MGRTFRTKIAGITHDNSDGTSREEILRKCFVGEHLLLQRDYGNAFDEYAIAVLRKTGEQIGFVPRYVAFRHPAMNDLAPHIDEGGKVTAHIVGLERDSQLGIWGKIFKTSQRVRECTIEISVGNAPYKVKEAEGRQLRDKAKSFERTDPKKAIELYKQSMMTLLEGDAMLRETRAFKQQIVELGRDLGTWRRTPVPIERITALLERSKNYSECLAEIESYEKIEDRKGLSRTDIQVVTKRRDRVKRIIYSIGQETEREQPSNESQITHNHKNAAD